jgi:K+/H+ antiporter YhaU regulatory subunit KhtT
MFINNPEKKFNENDQVVVVGKKADIQKIFTKQQRTKTDEILFSRSL